MQGRGPQAIDANPTGGATDRVVTTLAADGGVRIVRDRLATGTPVHLQELGCAAEDQRLRER